MGIEQRIAELSKNEKRYLRRWQCAWCDNSLASAGCFAFYEKCSEENRMDRLERCLSDYKQRGSKRDGSDPETGC